MSIGRSPDRMVHMILGLSPGRTICCGGSRASRGAAELFLEYDQDVSYYLVLFDKFDIKSPISNGNEQ